MEASDDFPFEEYCIEVPTELLEGSENNADTAARIARWVTLEELGFFGLEAMIKLSKGEYSGRFTAGVRKRFSGTYGNTNGCSAGDVELASELRGLVDGIDYLSAIYDYDIENSKKNGKKPKSS